MSITLSQLKAIGKKLGLTIPKMGLILNQVLGSRKLIPKLKKGELTKYGYSSKLNQTGRKKALKKAIKYYGKNSVIRKLNALYVLNKNRNPKLASKFKSDQVWISSSN